MNAIDFQLDGLTCKACVKLASKRIGKLEDVISVKIELNGEGTLSAGRAISKEEIKKALEGTDYKIV